MIVFDLKCVEGHVFEAWFKNSQVYEDQREAGEIQCPFCGDAQISKAVMAPNIAVGGSRPRDDNRMAEIESAAQGTPMRAVAPFSPPLEFRKAIEAFRDMVRENCDDVGRNFAEEARKIHYGEAEKRGIYGEASREESESLREDGIEFMELPIMIRTDS